MLFSFASLTQIMKIPSEILSTNSIVHLGAMKKDTKLTKGVSYKLYKEHNQDQDRKHSFSFLKSFLDSILKVRSIEWNKTQGKPSKVPRSRFLLGSDETSETQSSTTFWLIFSFALFTSFKSSGQILCKGHCRMTAMPFYFGIYPSLSLLHYNAYAFFQLVLSLPREAPLSSS